MEEWSLYVGVPVKKIKIRNNDKFLKWINEKNII
jgi:hypothetical protein